MSRWDEVTFGLVSASVDISHEELGRHKGISLTTTSNSETFQWISMMKNIKITN